jgi:starch phosphorylase
VAHDAVTEEVEASGAGHAPPETGRDAVTDALLQHYGCGPVRFSGTATALYDRHLTFDSVVPRDEATARNRFEAAARSIRDVLSQRWLLTEQTYRERDPKRVYYLSLEFLLGRSLASNVTNLRLDHLVRRTGEAGHLDWLEVLEQEPDAGLGNGGLGRLAACFIESMATMQLPAMGYGLRYEYGMFSQTIREGWQHEQPDHWLLYPDPWEVARPNETVEVHIGCSFEVRGGTLAVVRGRPLTLRGIPFDRPVVGYGGQTINTLRLWAAVAPDDFDFRAFSGGDFVSALAGRLSAESLTRVLYPDDTTNAGQGLRFFQEYFLVACSIADIVRRFRSRGGAWSELPEKAAIQLNDTHPAMAVPELLRVLLDEAHLGWDEAWDITVRTLAYTNHTLLPEALERWPRQFFLTGLPRHFELIEEIDRRLRADVAARWPADDGRAERITLFEAGEVPRVRMANLAIVGSHSTNGVAALHSQLLRTTTVADLAEMFPERFNNKTNGVTPRRWLLLPNPDLAACITEAIGSGWITDLSELEKLRSLVDDRAFQATGLQSKLAAKRRFATWLETAHGVTVDPQSIFDMQAKRIHEYKRQLLNALRIIALYDDIRRYPQAQVTPRTFFFAGKAAPAYRLAKIVIKFINNLARTIDADPAVRGRLKVVFLPDYSVSLAERLIPASDVSNQISTAGYEASGTSNMKFMMNGALTIGTRDGATIEMAAAAGEENFFLFGLTAAEVNGSRGWYDPRWHYDHEPRLRAVLDLIQSGHFNRDEPGIFDPLIESLLGTDRYMHLADFTSYMEADRRLLDLQADLEAWSRRVILNIAASGAFSSDRTIGEYAREIWGVTPCPVP